MSLAGSVARHAGTWMDPKLSEGFSVPELQAVIAPHLRGLVDGDSNASLAASTALLLGLTHQRRTGEGQFVATSMIGGNLYAYTDDAVTYAGKPPLPTPVISVTAACIASIAPGRWVFVAATTRPSGLRWCRSRRTDLAGDALRDGGRNAVTTTRVVGSCRRCSRATSRRMGASAHQA
jgi:crotonobetainyl-CoA:carnitine CoA-transferase CaiB-like acyl-CoA transferase